MAKGINQETGKSHKYIDRVGTRSGRLLFTRNLGQSKHKHSIWEAICDCGKITSTATPGKTRSCGCLRSEMMAELGRSSKKENPISKTKEYRKQMMKKLRSNPYYSMQARLSRLHRHALSQVNAIKTSPTFTELGYTVNEFVVHIEKQFAPAMSWSNMKDWQIDHIIPASTAKTRSDVVALNQLSNLRPMWADENNAKKNKIETLL
jgi:hypothetical protein